MNFPAIKALFQGLIDPKLFIPDITITGIHGLLLPFGEKLAASHGGNSPNERTAQVGTDIKAFVLDKDNCITAPNSDVIDPNARSKIDQLKRWYGQRNVLIVSNSAGYMPKDPEGKHMRKLSESTGLAVLWHSDPKPSQTVADSIFAHFNQVSEGTIRRGDQICIVGDRLLTDVALAKNMGACSVWLSRGVVHDQGPLTTLETLLLRYSAGRPWHTAANITKDEPAQPKKSDR